MKKKPNRREKPKKRHTGESRSADAITVFWMLTIVTLTLLDVGGGISLLFRRDDAPGTLLLPRYLAVVGSLVGVMSLGLLAPVHMLRRTKPPLAIVCFGIVVALAPVGLLAWSF